MLWLRILPKRLPSVTLHCKVVSEQLGSYTPCFSEAAEKGWDEADAYCAAQQSNTTGLVVISEEQDTRTLLIHEIQTEDIYQRQGGTTAMPRQEPLCLSLHVCRCCHEPCDSVSVLMRNLGSAEETIITWSDKEIQTDVALSFQTQDGCDTVW